MDYLDRITLDPAVRRGQPRIRNMRLTVWDVLEYLASGMDEAEVSADFPELEHEDFLACYSHAAAAGKAAI